MKAKVYKNFQLWSAYKYYNVIRKFIVFFSIMRFEAFLRCQYGYQCSETKRIC